MEPNPTPCPFCEIVAGRAPATMVMEWHDVIGFQPLNPVTDGHTLIVPRVHVPHFAANPTVSAATMARAAELMRWTPRPMNVITSRGREATQTVEHLHLHLVPRAEGDGLALPWDTPTADEIALLHAHLEDQADARQTAAESADRFRDVVCEVLGYDEENPGDDTTIAALRAHFGKSGPEPRRWRDFMVWANAQRDQINAAHADDTAGGAR